MGNPGVDVRIGWDESEQKEFMKAIRQPLMVQTPLQLVIENLFQRLQSQAAFMQQMKEKMERIAVKDVTADELLGRIKLLESQQGDAAGPKLNPFNQQEIISRLEVLESRLAADGPGIGGVDRSKRDTSSTSGEAGADFEARLQRLEKRLTGVYNINGKLVAVEQIAAGLGVPIPDLEYTTAGPAAGSGPGAASPGAPGSPSTHSAPPAAAAALPPLPMQAWRAAPQHPQHQQPQPHQAHASIDTRRPRSVERVESGATPTGTASGFANDGPSLFGFKVLTRSTSPPANGPTVDLAAGLSSSARGSPGHSPRAVGSPTGSPLGLIGLGGSHASNLTGAPGTPGGATAISSQKLVQLGQEVAALRVENEALKEAVESLTQQVAGLRTGLGSNAVESLSRLQQVEEAVGSLRAQLADLSAARRDAAGRHGSDVTFADFSLLRSQVEASVAEARGQAATAAALAERELPALAARVDELAEGLKKKSEPRDIDALFHERINALEGTMEDMKAELLGSIEAAMGAAVKLDDLQALEEVLEAKAPAEALRLLQQQTHALSQAVAGIGEAIALRPDVGDALRAAAAAGAGGGATGAAATKLRCLTCDQPIKAALGGSLGAGGFQGKGSFLPRLEAMPAKEGLPGGPGLMIAELRASKEDRLAGLQIGGTGGRGGSSGVNLKAADLEEYANGVGGGMGGMRGGSPPRDASPGRAVERSRAARVPVGGLAKPGGPPMAGKPVFL